MFPKVILLSLAIGALSVNALSIQVAREAAPEPDSQDVEARSIFDIFTRPVSIYGNPADKHKKKKKDQPKREISEDLLSREAEPETEELDARFGPAALLIPAGIATAAGVGAALGVGISRNKKPKREMLDDLLLREADPEIQELEARILPLLAAIPAVAAGAMGIKSLNKEKKAQGRREILDDLFSREAQDWTQWAESVRNQASKQ